MSGAQSLSITGPDRAGMLEGETYTITWAGSGIRSVSIVAEGTRTPLGTQSRGSFAIAVAEAVPAGEGAVSWTVPWIDSVSFRIRAKGYGEAGQEVTADARIYHFRPAVMADRLADGIYLALHEPRNQRLYVQSDTRITHAYLSSSSENYAWRPPCDHVPSAHDHAGVFRITEKRRLHHSTLFGVDMPWAMRYHRGHFVHATSPALYGDLGAPASAGCNRLTNHDARRLYQMTPVGTRIEVIGPGG